MSKPAGKLQTKTICIHRAPWIVTVDCNSRTLISERKPDTRFLLQNGGICVQGDSILAVGPFDSLTKEYYDADIIDHENSVLTPCLVNAHTHLELSYLPLEGSDLSWKGSIVVWIRDLVAKREASSPGNNEIERAARRALDHLHQSGTGLVCDIGNRYLSKDIGAGSKVFVVFFMELMGISRRSSSATLEFMEKEWENLHVTVHAPYSCDIPMITAVKKRANRLQQLFPIHVAESFSEIEFLRTGKGEFRDFLAERGSWDDSFTPVTDTAAGSVLYLDTLGVLDERTLCVHAVHVSPQEMDILAERKVKVCVCPGSNRYLGVGKAPVPDFLKRGIVPALGTDSMTSNPQLNIWQEMKALYQDHPGIHPAVIFTMATRGGAEALYNSDNFGKLCPGAPASFLEVDIENLGKGEVLEFLVTRGSDIRANWVSATGDG